MSNQNKKEAKEKLRVENLWLRKMKYIFIKTMDNKVQNFQSIICHLSFTGKNNGHFELSFQFRDVMIFFKHNIVRFIVNYSTFHKI